ncbi:MAG: ABC transporter permease [Candidatus Acidiferrum sp.]
MHTLWQDIQYGLRMLAKNPGFTAIAVVTLALGIGANTALFSVVNGVLLNPLPYQQPERLVALYTSRIKDSDRSSISYPNFLDWRRENHAFSALAAYRSDDFNLTGEGEPERLKVEMVSAAFFPLLGVKPVVGRLFTEQEDQLGGAPVALISEGLWKRKFGGSADVVGKSANLDATLYTIVGVIPGNFHYRNNNFDDNKDTYVPIGQWKEPLFQDRRAGMGMDAVGRLKPGITLQQAKADMAAVAAHLAEIYPGSNKDSGVALVPLKENVVEDIRPFLLLLLAAVGFVLLIACANVANLLLARSMGRTREFAIRTALGAGHGRIIRQMLTESVVLGLGGGVLGLLIAAWGTQAAIKALPDALPRAEEIHLDGRVLLFTFAASLFAAFMFGLIPALKTARAEIHETLKESGRGGSGARHRAQGVIVAVEIALALVLLTGAGLMIRSLGKLWNVNPGFDPQNVLNFGIAASQPLGQTPAETRAAIRRVQNVIATVPGVEAASLTAGATPMNGDSELPLWLDSESKPTTESEMKVSLFYIITPDYLKAMKIPLKRGRFLEDSDNEKSPFVVAIDEEFAKRFFGNSDPIGRHVNFDILNVTAEVVGVVGHVKQWGMDEDSSNSIQAQGYFSMAQIPDAFMPMLAHGVQAIVRVNPNMLGNASPISQAVGTLNSQMVVYGTKTMTEIVADSLAQKRFAMMLLGMFAALATVLSLVGIYGVISYIAGQRTHEIGIRMAMGAERRDVLRMMLGQAGKMALIGVVIGLMASFGLMRLMSSMLFGVSAHDPVTFLVVALALTLVALAACLVPARRATRVDPMVALRYE